jgi:hypothetical protein
MRKERVRIGRGIIAVKEAKESNNYPTVVG